jgi:DNA repair photolyase
MSFEAPVAKPLVGIARQAASGDLLEIKRRVEYRSLPTKSWLNPCRSTRVPFNWTINPFRGCEFACQYCYARYTHGYLERDELTSFETEIFAKSWNAESFRRELRQVRSGQTLAIGTATDPYQPAERRFLLTRRVLECLTMIRGIRVCLTTKSDLIARDADLLSKISQHNKAYVSITITTPEPSLARLTEPLAPHPSLRFSALATLRSHGVAAGVTVSPILPYITDGRKNLEALAGAARHAGATHFGGGILFLRDATRTVYFNFLNRCFPELVPLYEASFRQSSNPQPSYLAQIRKLVEEVRKSSGIDQRDLPFYKEAETDSAADGQLSLFSELVVL